MAFLAYTSIKNITRFYPYKLWYTYLDNKTITVEVTSCEFNEESNHNFFSVEFKDADLSKFNDRLNNDPAGIKQKHFSLWLAEFFTYLSTEKIPVDHPVFVALSRKPTLYTKTIVGWRCYNGLNVRVKRGDQK